MHAVQPMQEVVLIDAGTLPPDGTVVVDVATAEPAVRDRARARARARRRLRRWWPVAAGLTLVLVTATVVDDRRAIARQAELDKVPGILLPLDGPVSELWRSGEAQFSDLAEVAGRLVGVENRRDGSIDIVALDPETGEDLWRVGARPAGDLDTGARCAWPQAGSSPDSDSPPLGVCVVVDEADGSSGPDAQSLFSTGARLLVLDATTGTVLSVRPTDPTTSVATLGSDLVTGRVDPAGTVHVARSDPLGQAQRWTFVSPTPVPKRTVNIPGATVSVTAGLVVVNGVSGWVLDGDGAVIHAWTSDPTTWDGGRVGVLGAGTLLVERGTAAAGAAGSNVVDLTTGHAFTDNGYAISPNPDDGSLAELVLTQAARVNTLVAYEAATGRRLWIAPGAKGGDLVLGSLLVIDRRVVRAEADKLRAVDGRSGETIWTTSIVRPALSSLFSDGRIVLRASTSPGLGTVLAAYGLNDGRIVWQSDISDDVTLLAIGGRLYGRSDDGLVALR